MDTSRGGAAVEQAGLALGAVAADPLPAVRSLTPAASAASVSVSESSPTRRTITARPFGPASR